VGFWLPLPVERVRNSGRGLGTHLEPSWGSKATGREDRRIRAGALMKELATLA